jgi:hypothetical protein
MADESQSEMTIGELKTHVDERFAGIDRRFQEVDRRFEHIDQRFLDLEKRIAEEGVKTRRHFDIVAESFKTEFRLFGERGDADHQQLEDHERRIRALESRRRR